ncbi:MAG TPA: M67 family metallopeptidase [Candidatus Saccharimonadia bacterium]|nr:M67 family metallopeptidase [Candidatus Saccharimonadia bacterium]
MVGEPEPAAPGDGHPDSRGNLARTSQPAAAHLSPELHAELVAWARAGVPNEACGILAGERAAIDGGRAIAFYPLTNAEASPFLYRIDPVEQLHAMVAIDDADQVVWGIFHSHVASPAAPSVTDIGLAFYPEALYVICSLADADAPHLRAWSIRDGQVAEVALVTR